MAVTFNSDAQVVFFTKVLGATHPVISKVKALIDTGITFEVSLYAVRAFTAGKKPVVDPVQLSYGTTALMKGTVSPELLLHNQKLIVDWVSYLYEKQGKPTGKPVVKPVVGSSTATKVLLTGLSNPLKKLPLIKAVHKVMGASVTLAEAKNVVENPTQVIGTFSTADIAKAIAKQLEDAGGITQLELVGIDFGVNEPVTVTPAAKPVPTDAVVHLKNAKALGQKVHGTSTGSVYYTIALSEHVRVAARITGGSISIRAEWTDNPQAELEKLTDAGVQMKTGYGSIHFDAAGVPVQRVIGAFLLGTGIQWKQVITSGAELVVA